MSATRTLTKDITQENRADHPVVQHLQRQVANAFVLYANYKHYHWQTFGPLFRDLHSMFDQFAKEVLDTIDEIAERIRIIGQDIENVQLKQMQEAASAHSSVAGQTTREMIEEADANSLVVIKELREAAKIADVRSHLPALTTVCAFDGKFPGVDCTLAELEARGAATDSADAGASYKSRALGVRPDDLATIIYTSGTTGEPKGVMLTHGNIASNVMTSRELLPMRDEVTLSFLPLSHIFERMAGHYLMIATGTSIAYAESVERGIL